VANRIGQGRLAARSLIDGAERLTRGDAVRPPLDALPVRLRLAGPHAEAIRRWLASVAGWQEVTDDAALIPPRLQVADVPGLRDSGEAEPDGTSCVLLVTDEDTAAAAAAAALRADAIIVWPGDRDDLPAIGGELTGQQPTHERRELRVGGASGGVGTTTVALGIAGLAAWALGPVLVLGHGEIPIPSPRALAHDDLAGPGTWGAATTAPGLPGLRVVRLPGPPGSAPVDPGPATLVVRDAGVDADVDVLVLRRDAAGLDALERSAAAISVLVETGPASQRLVSVAAGRRRVVAVGWSSRVARAGLNRRIPTGLPGTWLASLRGIVVEEMAP
jgi:hypothetical protein